MVMNGKPCLVLQDSAATIVHPSYVEPGQFTGECIWIKQAVEINRVCLSIANVSIEGPFGVLHTKAAVSASLPVQYPYLFSNKSDQLLWQKGLVFREGAVNALSRSKVQELLAKAILLKEPSGAETPESEPLDRAETVSAPVTEELDSRDTPDSSKDCLKFKEACGELLITPASDSLQRLPGLDRSSLIAEQWPDPTLRNLMFREKKVSRRKMSCSKKGPECSI